MKCDGNRVWNLRLDFVRGGRAEFHCPVTGKNEPLTWSIKTFPRRLSPISLVQCRMRGMGFEVFGYGDSFFYKSSLTQAFAEAWERLWICVFSGHSSLLSTNIKNSNGFACGPSIRAAMENAESELLERAFFLKAWDSRRGWARIRAGGVVNGILSLTLENLGWRLDFFKITETRLGFVVCCIGIRDEGGVLFDCCYCKTEMGMREALSKVLRSNLRTALVVADRDIVPDGLPEKGAPMHHFAFYGDVDHYKAFEFLNGRCGASDIVLGHYDETRSEVLVDIADFPFVALATNPLWPQLSWGRESIREGGNPWPHPLA